MYLCSLSKEIYIKKNVKNKRLKEIKLILDFNSNNFLSKIDQLNIHKPTVEKFKLDNLVNEIQFSRQDLI